MKTKYNNSKISTPDGIFDSKKEYLRFCELKNMEAKGLITELNRQVRFTLIPAQYQYVKSKNGQKCVLKCVERGCDYIADFNYMKNGEEIVEDVKGYKKGGAYSVYVIKRKLMLQKYGIKIKEV